MDSENNKSIILHYVNDLRTRENDIEIKYDKLKSTLKNLNISNQTFTSLSVATGAGGIATGITVIGAPVAVGLGVAAAICGTASFVLTGIGKRYIGRVEKLKEQLTIIRDARINLERILAFAIKRDEFKSLTDAELQEFIEIYYEALKKNKMKPLELRLNEKLPLLQST